MTDHATPNLPAGDFGKTTEFYTALGFTQTFRDNGWMILKRGGIVLEFFPFPDLDPGTSAFSACLRLDDLDGFFAVCRAAGVPETHKGWPRLVLPRTENGGVRVGYLVDPDCSLLRLVQN